MTAILDDVRARAEALMHELGTEVLGESLLAEGWAFDFDRARVRLGRCSYWPKRITLGTAHAAAGWTAEVEDTVRHEIAHALDFETRGRSGHDAVWRDLAVRCGASPERGQRGPRPRDDASPYRGACPACGHDEPFYQPAPRAHRCPVCQGAVLGVTHRRSGRLVRPSYIGTCGGCGASHVYPRLPHYTIACGVCCCTHNGGRFDRRFVLVMRRTREEDFAAIDTLREAQDAAGNERV